MYVEKNDVFEKTLDEVRREDMIKDKLKREERNSFNDENVFKPFLPNTHSYNYGLSVTHILSNFFYPLILCNGNYFLYISYKL